MKFNNFGKALCLGVVLCVGSMAEASRFDVQAGRTGGPANGAANCRSCHGNAVGNGSVEIFGAPSQYIADMVYDLTVRISDPVQVGAGFQISVEDSLGNHVGTLSVVDAVRTELNNDDPAYLNHTSDGVDASIAAWASNGNSYTYPVRWTAPSTDMGTVTFYAAGNAINNNFSLSGDLIYLTTKSATFVAVPAASTWGLVVFMLSMLIAGTLLSVRRRPTAAPVCIQ